ncbi:MAG TPA: hypothetical protein DD381_07895 [Lentisphaeria bacterium]|nr:MAG: hypothetical protein A2X47_04460 [Lentisphaerae bacterium GWF2_38_69]HBM16243.1 hypothetical protein [Lentisphaeria bacterium]
MREFIPPFKQLIAFEAVARLKSFSKSAEELNITHSAVSQNINSLEKLLGKSLIKRNTHKVELTSIGELYYNEISKNFSFRQGSKLDKIATSEKLRFSP